jgi:Domain of unknown function (DUF4105)
MIQIKISLLFVFITFLVLINLIDQTSKVYADTIPYIEDLITQAQSKKIWEQRAWRKLLFIPDRFFYSSDHSLISEKSFFFSFDGRNNPEHELVATLKAFNDPMPLNPKKNYMHPQCRYAARFHWLVEELKIDPKRMEFQPCPELHKFIDYLDYEGVSLVFSNYVADGPGSLFGHTFLRLHRNTDLQSDSALLDDIANFSAFVPAVKSWLYPIKGLSGGYQGRFSVVPYYQKIQEYNNYESRDLWEYRLNLSKKEIRLLELVLWEVGWTYIDYYYLDDNCAYIMLAVLEAAKPELRLTGSTRLYAIPSDTIRVVARVPNLVRSVTYRPSVLSRYIIRISVLNESEKQRLEKLVLSNNQSSISSILQGCDKQCQAKIIDSALEYIDYKEKLVGSNDPVEYRDLRSNLLLARAQEEVKSDPLIDSPQSSSPDLGHDSGLVSLSMGTTFTGDPFSDLRWRPALHDIEANDQGYSNGLGIGFLDTIVRVDYKNKEIYLKDFHLLEITSLPSQVPNIHFLAWHFDTGYEYGFGFGDSATEGREYLQLGIGSALFSFENQALLFAIIHGDMGYSSDFGAHIGPTLSLGAMAKLSPRFKFIVKSEFAKRFNYERSIDSMEYSLTLSSYLTQNFEAQINLANKEGIGEVSLALRYYF